MGISHVGQTQSGSNATSYPGGLQAGDYILYFGYRNTTTAPSIPSGFTNISNQSANGNSFRLVYKIATGSESGSVTMTNANVVHMAVYRGVSRIGGAGSTTNASAGTTTISGIGTLHDNSGPSWVVSYGGSLQTTSMSTPTGTTLRGTAQTGTSCMALICDSNGSSVTSWGQRSSTNGTNAAGGGGSVELVAVGSKVETLTDLFNQSSLDSAKWTQTTGGSASMSYDSTGALVTFPASSTASTIGQVQSKSLFDLTASYGYVQGLAVPSASTAANGELRLQIDANNWVRWVYEAGTLYAQRMVAGSRNNVTSFSYSSTTHKYWRIREASGTTYWDTSSDGSSWTNQGSFANPIAVTALRVMVLGSCYQAETSPGTFKFNNLNTQPSAPTANNGQFFAFF